MLAQLPRFTCENLIGDFLLHMSLGLPNSSDSSVDYHRSRARPSCSAPSKQAISGANLYRKYIFKRLLLHDHLVRQYLNSGLTAQVVLSAQLSYCVES